MKTKPSPALLHDEPVNPKIVLAGLWTAMLMVFAYVDIFGFFRADIIEAARAGEVAGIGVVINQGFLVFSTVFVLIPIAMIVISLLASPGLNRRANIATSILYAVVIAGLCIGETWVYYLLGSAVEVVLLLMIARRAWTWPSAVGSSEEVAKPAAHLLG
ncbi:hypothetical protein K0651_07525 [Ornithinimicrobium sp. Arc0846-15]|nr:hypothetical protein [Ornithinimicrobium laminariae]